MFLYLGQEIPASSAVEYLRIECVEEAEQLNFCFFVAQGLCWVVRAVQVSAGRIRASVASVRRERSSCCERECARARRLQHFWRYLKTEHRECVQKNLRRNQRRTKLRRDSSFVHCGNRPGSGHIERRWCRGTRFRRRRIDGEESP